MIDMNVFWGEVKAQMAAMIQAGLGDYGEAAVRDAETFLARTRADFEHWTVLFANGVLKPDEYAWLVTGEKDLADLAALREAGLSAPALEIFRDNLVSTVVATACRLCV